MKIWLLNLFFYKCGDNDTSVATNVATLLKKLDAAGLKDTQFLILTEIVLGPCFVATNCHNVYIGCLFFYPNPILLCYSKGNVSPIAN